MAKRILFWFAISVFCWAVIFLVIKVGLDYYFPTGFSPSSGPVDSSFESQGQWYGLCDKDSIKSIEGFRLTVMADPILRDHYQSFDWRAARVEHLEKVTPAHVYYRKGDRIFMKGEPIMLPAGDAYITDGHTRVRIHCCNNFVETFDEETAEGEAGAGGWWIFGSGGSGGWLRGIGGAIGGWFGGGGSGSGSGGFSHNKPVCPPVIPPVVPPTPTPVPEPATFVLVAVGVVLCFMGKVYIFSLIR